MRLLFLLLSSLGLMNWSESLWELGKTACIRGGKMRWIPCFSLYGKAPLVLSGQDSVCEGINHNHKRQKPFVTEY